MAWLPSCTSLTPILHVSSCNPHDLWLGPLGDSMGMSVMRVVVSLHRAVQRSPLPVRPRAWPAQPLMHQPMARDFLLT